MPVQRQPGESQARVFDRGVGVTGWRDVCDAFTDTLRKLGAAACGTLAQQRPARGDGELRVFLDGQHDRRPDLKPFQWLLAGTARDAPAAVIDILCVGQPQLR